MISSPMSDNSFKNDKKKTVGHNERTTCFELFKNEKPNNDTIV